MTPRRCRMNLKNCVMALCVSALVLCCTSALARMLADTVYHNGTIYTMTETPEEAKDPANAKTVDVVAVRDGVIVFAGSSAEAGAAGYLAPENVRRMADLRGKIMYPGFIDGHGHFPSQGESDLYQVNLGSPLLGGPAGDMDALVAALKAKAEITPEGDPILGWNYDDTMLAEKRHPTRHDLDRASTRHPIYIGHISGHMGVANSRALAKYNVTRETTVTGVVKDESGEPTGLLMELEAMGLVPLKDELRSNARAGIARASQLYAAAGVTCADDGASVLQQRIPGFQACLSGGTLQLRVLVHPVGYYPRKIDMDGKPVHIDVMGWMGRAALGWLQAPDDPLREYADGSSALAIGSDITSMDVAVYDPVTKERTVSLPAPANLPAGMFLLAPWKMFLDGSPQGYTAWFKDPGYYDWDGRTAAESFDPAAKSFIGLPGTLNFQPEDLDRWVANYHRYGQSIEVHTNGPAAAETFLAAIERAVASFPDVSDTRHAFIHGQTLERQHIERMMGLYHGLPGTEGMYTGLSGAFAGGKVDTTMGGLLPSGNLGELMAAQNLFVSYFNNHTYFYGHRHFSKFFGPGRAKNMSPAGWSLAYGQRFSFHNDTPVTPISPLRSIQSGVTRVCGDTDDGYAVTGTSRELDARARYLPNIFATEKSDFWDYDHRVNALQALHAITTGPAWQNRMENRLGSIESGKAADFTILDEDIIAVAASDPMRLASLRIAATIVGDKVVHGVLPDSEALAGQLLPDYEETDLFGLVVEGISNADAEQRYAPLAAGEKRLGTFAFSAGGRSAGGNGTAVFRMNFPGNGGIVDSMRLYAFGDAGKKSFIYGRTGNKPVPGEWWIASMHSPTTPLASSAVLERDRYYIAFFAMPAVNASGSGQGGNATFGGVVTLATTGELPENGFPGRHPATKDALTSGLYFPAFGALKERDGRWNGLALKNWADAAVNARIFLMEQDGGAGYLDVTIPQHSMYVENLREMLPRFRRIAGGKPLGGAGCAISVALPAQADVDGFAVIAGEDGETAAYLARPWDGASALPGACFPYLTETFAESGFQNVISIFNPDGKARDIRLDFQEQDGDRGTILVPAAGRFFKADLSRLLGDVQKEPSNSGLLGDSRVSVTARAQDENATLFGLATLVRRASGESASYLAVPAGEAESEVSGLHFPYFTALNGGDGYWNGLALINGEDRDVPATLHVLEDSGNAGTLDIIIPTRSMYVTELGRIVPEIRPTSGAHPFGAARAAITVVLKEPSRVQGFAMIARPDTGESASYLAQRSHRDAGGNTLRFPYFTEMNGKGGWWNGISVVDPDSIARGIRMYFEEEDGDRGVLILPFEGPGRFFTSELGAILPDIEADRANRGVLGDARVSIRIQADSPRARLLGFAMIGADGSDGPRRNSMGYLPLHMAD